MESFVRELLGDGYPAAQLCAQMLEAMLQEGATADRRRPRLGAEGKISVQLAEVDKNLIDGADEYLQLTNLLAFTMRQCKA